MTTRVCNQCGDEHPVLERRCSTDFLLHLSALRHLAKNAGSSAFGATQTDLRAMDKSNEFWKPQTFIEYLASTGWTASDVLHFLNECSDFAVSNYVHFDT